MSRNLHISRTIDMMFGAYITDKSGPIEQITKEMQGLVSEINTAGNRYREILTKNTPAIYVVDCEDVANILSLELSTKRSTKNFSKSGELEASFGGNSRLKEFVKADGLDAISAFMSDKSLVSELAGFLYTSFSSGGTVIGKSSKTTQTLFGAIVETEYSPSGTYRAIPAGNLSEIYKNCENLYVKYRGAVAAEMRGGRSYAKIQALGVKLGKDLFDYLKSIDTFIVSDSSKFIKLPNKKSVVICGSSFNTVVTATNRVLDNAFRYFIYNKNKELLDYFKSYDDRTDKDKKYFSIGFLINAGHTSASAVTSSGKRTLGVNMPSAQQAQVTMPKVLAESLESELSELYVDIGYDVEFTKNIRAAKTLLELNFAFVITMPAALNTKSLNVAEQALLKRYTKDIEKTLQKFASNKKVLDIATNYLPISNASPTIVEDFRNSIISILKGEKTFPNPTKYRNTNKLTSSKMKITRTGKNTNKPATKQRSGTSKSGAVPSVQIKQIVEPLSNLVSLQNLINANLADQIKKNMGDGNARNVLNLRTGRLAESAKVERMSESRAGMITAFYSYMKNPYATFSEGGRQQYPRSRDPKLLISKSIREIAQQQVANRLRAVLV